jgi:hypothetical protein
MSEMQNIEVTKRVWGPWATAGFGVVVIIISLIIQVIVLILLLLINMFSHFNASSGTPEFADMLDVFELAFSTNLGLFTALATCVSAIVCIGFIILFVRVRQGVRIKEYLGLRPITGKTVWVSLAIMAGFMVLSSGIDTSLERPVPEFMIDIYSTSVWPWLLWVAIVIFAPVFEETFFRGFLFAGFVQSRMGSAGTIALTALGWALLHIQYGSYEIATIFVLGILLGIVRLKTRSLWSPLLMHVFNNLVAMLLLTLSANGLLS